MRQRQRRRPGPSGPYSSKRVAGRPPASRRRSPRGTALRWRRFARRHRWAWGCRTSSGPPWRRERGLPEWRVHSLIRSKSLVKPAAWPNRLLAFASVLQPLAAVPARSYVSSRELAPSEDVWRAVFEPADRALRAALPCTSDRTARRPTQELSEVRVAAPASILKRTQPAVRSTNAGPRKNC